jgi:hypothetical protein
MGFRGQHRCGIKPIVRPRGERFGIDAPSGRLRDRRRAGGAELMRERLLEDAIAF